MAKFAKNVDLNKVAHRQAVNVIKQVQGSILKSVGTVRNYEQALKHVAFYANQSLGCGLRDITLTQAHQYLVDRAAVVGQKTVDMDRQAIQCMMQHVSKALDKDQSLFVVKSEHQQHLTSRSYTPSQIALIANAQTDRNALSTLIAHAAGLRAHELNTLLRIEERNPDIRETSHDKFSERTGARYTVDGKGGLIREVQISYELAQKLEGRRLDAPQRIRDRGIFYNKHYDIGGGKAWSNSFSSASERVLGWSAGGHGLRHRYAQERMSELQKKVRYRDALKVVSLEMGHIRAEITEVYLR